MTAIAFLRPAALTMKVQAWSGRDDHLLWEIDGGRGSFSTGFAWTLIGDLDLNGDGRPDVALTEPLAGKRYGTVHAYDHRGERLWTVTGTTEVAFGFTRSNNYEAGKMGDLDGDGCDDLILRGWDGLQQLPCSVVLSGKDGSVLVQGLGDSPADLWGLANDGCGDMDGDGVLDWATCQGGTGSLGGSRVFSGATGAPIWTWRDPAISLGGEVDAGGGVDVDRDGVPDVAVAAAGAVFPRVQPATGAAKVLSGRDGGDVLLVWPATTNTSGMSSQLELVRDSNGGFPLLMTWDRLRGACTGGLCGRLTLWRLAPPGVTRFGTECRGTLPDAPQIGIRTTASGTRIQLGHGPPGGLAVLVLGLSRTAWGTTPLPLPLAQFGFAGCSLLASIDLAVPVPVSTGVHGGYAFVDLPLPLGSAVEVYGQWLALGVGAGATAGASDALSWRH